MELFIVKDTKTNKRVGWGFENKASAKAVRNEYNGDSKAFRYIINKGKDHWRYR